MVRILVVDQADHRHERRDVERNGALAQHLVPDGESEALQHLGHRTGIHQVERLRKADSPENLGRQRRRVDLHRETGDLALRYDRYLHGHRLLDLLHGVDIPVDKRNHGSGLGAFGQVKRQRLGHALPGTVGHRHAELVIRSLVINHDKRHEARNVDRQCRLTEYCIPNGQAQRGKTLGDIGRCRIGQAEAARETHHRQHLVRQEGRVDRDRQLLDLARSRHIDPHGHVLHHLLGLIDARTGEFNRRSIGALASFVILAATGKKAGHRGEHCRHRQYFSHSQPNE